MNVYEFEIGAYDARGAHGHARHAVEAARLVQAVDTLIEDIRGIDAIYTARRNGGRFHAVNEPAALRAIPHGERGRRNP